VLINKKRRISPELLFPGFQLSQAVYTTKSLSSLVGQIFESLTEHFLGGDQRTTNSATDCCPDVVNDDSHSMIESKASNFRSQFKVHHHQIIDYVKAHKDGWDVSYAFWSYGENQLRKKYKTRDRIIEAILKNILYLDVVHISIIEAIMKYQIRIREDGWPELRDDNERLPGVRTILFWGPKEQAEYEAMVGANPMTLLSPPFFRWLRSEPDVVLKTLGLADTAYEYHGEGKMNCYCKYDGVKMRTGSFTAWRYQPAEDCDAPF